mmetsp:Transcript_6606/g.13805  ORF Transcript_6606/g.13805 Transcript_6606/m.13805 type:complete len:237 (+) Transcript_6606:376-1086(+)
MRHPGSGRIASERVLLRIGAPKNPVAEQVERQHTHQLPGRQQRVVIRQIHRLQRVGGGHPREVSETEHEPKPVRRHVHGGQDRPLLKLRVPHVQALEAEQQRHTRGDVSKIFVLARRGREVHHEPSDKAGTEFAEHFEVERAREPAGIQLASDKKVVRVVSGVSAVRQHLGAGRRVLHGRERAGVEIQRKERRQDGGGRGRLRVCVRECREVARGVRAGGRDRGYPEGDVRIQTVL